jgi:hypothetical protein
LENIVTRGDMHFPRNKSLHGWGAAAAGERAQRRDAEKSFHATFHARERVKTRISVHFSGMQDFRPKAIGVEKPHLP